MSEANADQERRRKTIGFRRLMGLAERKAPGIPKAVVIANRRLEWRGAWIEVGPPRGDEVTVDTTAQIRRRS